MAISIDDLLLAAKANNAKFDPQTGKLLPEWSSEGGQEPVPTNTYADNYADNYTA